MKWKTIVGNINYSKESYDKLESFLKKFDEHVDRVTNVYGRITITTVRPKKNRKILNEQDKQTQ